MRGAYIIMITVCLSPRNCLLSVCLMISTDVTGTAQVLKRSSLNDFVMHGKSPDYVPEEKYIHIPRQKKHLQSLLEILEARKTLL